jgi:hypothetical protein
MRLEAWAMVIAPRLAVEKGVLGCGVPYKEKDMVKGQERPSPKSNFQILHAHDCRLHEPIKRKLLLVYSVQDSVAEEILIPLKDCTGWCGLPYLLLTQEIEIHTSWTMTSRRKPV